MSERRSYLYPAFAVLSLLGVGGSFLVNGSVSQEQLAAVAMICLLPPLFSLAFFTPRFSLLGPDQVTPAAGAQAKRRRLTMVAVGGMLFRGSSVALVSVHPGGLLFTIFLAG